MGSQYLDTGWIGIAITLMVVAFVLFNISRAKRGKELFIRRIAGLNAIDEAVGRATELGKPVFMVPGLSDNINAKSMQAINIFAYVSRVASRFSNPIMVCCYNASILAVAQEVIRDVYQQEGAVEKYDPDSVRFISDRQFAFAASTAGLMLREQAAACFFLGEFYAESLILAETANSIGAIQVASSTELTQTPFFIAACDYVLIGDEFYAASAYLTRQPVLVGSLIGQDWGKLTLASMVAVGVISTTIQMTGAPVTSTFKEEKLDKPRRLKQSETTFTHLLKPDTSKLEEEFKKNNRREKEPKTDETGASQGTADQGGQ
ncbi:hypothetical protein EON82_01770 [bacterium]|nr:MAG: hypothetical protein EON82_01770 [bacterium]